MLKRVPAAAVLFVTVMAVTAATAFAQSTGSAQTPAKPQASQPAPAPSTTVSEETRPATTTIRGDTGLWFVPTGEVLPARRWSLSAYRVNFDFSQGFTDVSDWPVTFGVGLGDRAEIFGAWTLVRRIDRDVRPILAENCLTYSASISPRGTAAKS